MEHVLISGATGYLGCNLVRRLNREGVEITVFCRESSDFSNLEGCKFNTFSGNMLSIEDWQSALVGVDAVFHLAACTSLMGCDKAIRQESNIEITCVLIDSLQSYPDIRLIYSSSAGAIGFNYGAGVMEEDHSFDAHHIDYFLSKQKSEKLIIKETARKLDAVILNVATIIGGRGMRGVQCDVFRKIARGKMLFFPPGGSCFVYVMDVVDGMIAAWRKGCSGERYILGGYNMTFEEYFAKLADSFEARRPFIRIPRVLLPIGGYIAEKLFNHVGRDTAILAAGFGYYNSDKAIQELGYKISPFEQVAESIKANIQLL